VASAIGSCTSHRRHAHASAAPPPAAPPSNVHLRSPTLSRAQPLVTRPPAAHPPTGTGAGGVGRRRTRSQYWWPRVRAGRWAAAPCAVVRAGERRRRGRRRCPRRGPSGPRAVRRGTGRGTLDGAREPGQTGDGAATHFTALGRREESFERRHAKRIFRRSQSASRGGSPPPDWLPPNGLGAALAHHASGTPRGEVGEPSLASGKKDSALHSFTSSVLFCPHVNKAP